MISLVNRNDHHFAEAIVQIQESERKKIAQELHDEIGQYLTAIHIDASAIIATKELQSARVIASEIDTVSLQMMGIFKSLLQQIRPYDGREMSLSKLFSTWQKRNKHVALSVQFSKEIDESDKLALIAIYRLVQEFLTNVSRHSEAKNVSIDLAKNDENILLIMKDDGKGFQMDEISENFGLLGMRERVEELEGKFDLLTYPNEGVRINVVIPVLQ